MSLTRIVAIFGLLILAAWWAVVIVDWSSYWNAVTGGGP